MMMIKKRKTSTFILIEIIFDEAIRKFEFPLIDNIVVP